jgi:hypothetical protein
MTMTTLAWLGSAAYAAHILEEYAFDWRNWARGVLHLPVEWTDFYVTNGVVAVFGIAQAMLAPTLPLAVFELCRLDVRQCRLGARHAFHPDRRPLLPRADHGRFVLPSAQPRNFWTAWTSGIANVGEIGLGLVIGAATLAYPIAMLNMKSWPYFRRDALT